MFPYGSLDLVVDDWHLQQDLHLESFQHGKHFLFDDFFYNQRNCNDDMRLDFGKCFEYDLRAGHSGEEVHMASAAYFIQEFKGQSVHVCHGKHGNNPVAGLEAQHLECELCVRPQCTIGKHYSLGETGGSRRVIDDSQFVRHIPPVSNVFLTEIARELLSEQFIQMVACILQLFAPAHLQGEVGHQDNTFQQRHFGFVQSFPYHITYEEQTCFGMIDNIMNVVRLEFMQDRHGYCTISQDGQKSYAPMGTVSSA